MPERRHWAEYAIESAGLGLFMVSALVFTALIEHPGSPVRAAIDSALLRRMVVGAAMGLTAASIIYSPWGMRSGAHLNPAVTLTFLRLGKISRRDAAGYVVAQFAGAAAGILVGMLAAAQVAADPAVNYVATLPGTAGLAAAFAGEVVISFGLMTAVLTASNDTRLSHFTGAIAACLIAAYITVEAPLSGMSMNPARSFAPALAAGAAETLWIYFLAPPLGMLIAAEVYVRRHGASRVRCAKLHHPASGPCLFNCR